MRLNFEVRYLDCASWPMRLGVECELNTEFALDTNCLCLRGATGDGLVMVAVICSIFDSQPRLRCAEQLRLIISPQMQ